MAQGYSVSGITFPVTVPAGQSVPFTVTFEPQTSGTSTGSVTFYSNATNTPSVETLTGTGTEATQHSVNLPWNPSTSQVGGYNLYRARNPGPIQHAEFVSALEYKLCRRERPIWGDLLLCRHGGHLE